VGVKGQIEKQSALDKNRFIFKIILASSVILEGEKKLGRFKKNLAIWGSCCRFLLNGEQNF
jgi:hypothetical protein